MDFQENYRILWIPVEMQKRLVTRRGPQPMGPKPIKPKEIHTLLGGRLLPEMTESARIAEIRDFMIFMEFC